MCGIVGYIGRRNALEVVLDCLKRLEYRGYDSAGAVILNDEKGFYYKKSPGKIQSLIDSIKNISSKRGNIPHLPSIDSINIGLGHTRWATHGVPTEINAHPHLSCDGAIAIVHNGIIENFSELREKLISKGHKFVSETDTEAIVHLVEEYYKGNPLEAVRASVEELIGSFAFGVVFKSRPDMLLAVRMNSPLVVGTNKTENFVASDISAFLPYTRNVSYLQDGEIIEIRGDSIRVFDTDGREKDFKPTTVTWTASTAEKEGYPHYMLKEIFEQPKVVVAELGGRLNEKRGRINLDELDIQPSFLKKVNRVVITACGTAWHSALVGKYSIEEFAKLPVDVGLASELRYGNTPIDKGTLVIAISQSGETADTLAAVRMAKKKGAKVLAITNIKGSSISRGADNVMYMRAGLEIGVAATKTYISQLVCVTLFALYLATIRKSTSPKVVSNLIKELESVPEKLDSIFANVNVIRQCADAFKKDHDFLYIGRRYNLATAYEGALKMKEISYLHAEGYGGGEMKHGPLALVDENLATIAIATRSRVYDKMLSNIQEVRARKGKIIAVATKGDNTIPAVSEYIFSVPDIDETLSPILAIVPLQLLAYYTATALGRDVDQPRNLAKSVTVE